MTAEQGYFRRAITAVRSVMYNGTERAKITDIQPHPDHRKFDKFVYTLRLTSGREEQRTYRGVGSDPYDFNPVPETFSPEHHIGKTIERPRRRAFTGGLKGALEIVKQSL